MQPQQQQQMVVTSAVPVVQPVYVSQPYHTASEVSTYRHRQSTIIGILLIVGGCLSIVFNIVDLAVGTDVRCNGYYCSGYYKDLSYYSNGVAGHGFWCGVLVSSDYITSLIWCDSTFSRFDTTPACDGVTDRRTDGRTDTRRQYIPRVAGSRGLKTF